MIYDFCVIGAGIVGLSTAVKLLERHPGASLIVLEKEAAVATHQTGHNSGVIHSGIYYAPGTLKADLCKRGAIATKEFCAEHGVDFEVPGKLIVATNPLELTRLEKLAERATANGIDIDTLSEGGIRDREPEISGMGAIFVKTAGIVDYKAVSRAMAAAITTAGGVLQYDVEVISIVETIDTVTVRSAGDEWNACHLVVCGGLQSDRLARLAGIRTEHQIVPFRGEYYRLSPDKGALVKHLIYPVPDPDLPFLGVHLTVMIDGSITLGPNAVLGFAREGYRKGSFAFKDVAEFLQFPGFWRTVSANLTNGAMEMRNSFFKNSYLRECQKYCPSLQLTDLIPMEAGIRAQAVMRDGQLVQDFLFLETERSLHVCNAPSPAATSALPIGSMIADKVANARSRNSLRVS